MNGDTTTATSARDSVEHDPAATVDTRERLVRAAIEVFLEKGYGGTRVQDIARRAGFTSGALYVHFPSRTALLGEAIIREGDTILRSMAADLAAAGERDGLIAEMLAGHSAGGPTDHDRLLLEALALATRDSEARATLVEPLAVYVDALQGQIADAQRRGVIDRGLTLDAVTHLMLSWVFGAVMTTALGLVHVDADEISATNDRLLGGLRPVA